MVKPNTVGNTGAASNGNSWEGLTSMKMGVAHGEVIENKKASLASKWEAWKARKAEDKALKAYDKKFDKNVDVLRKTNEEQNSLYEEKAELYKEADARLQEREALSKKLDESKAEYQSHNDNILRVAKDQVKNAFELFGKKSELIKKSVRAFWKNNPKISIGDLAASIDVSKVGERSGKKNKNKANARGGFLDSLPKDLREKIKEASNAQKEKAQAKESVEASKKNISSRWEAYKKDKKERASAKETLSNMKKEFADAKKREKEARDAFEEKTEEYKRTEKIREEANELKQKYDDAKEASEAAKSNVERAEKIGKLHEQLGKRDTKEVKAELAEKIKEKQSVIDETVAAYCAAFGVASEAELPADKKPLLEVIKKNSGGKELEGLKEQMAVVDEYEGEKKKQAEALAQVEPVKKGIKGFLSGFFSRKFAFAMPSDEDEEELERRRNNNSLI